MSATLPWNSATAFLMCFVISVGPAIPPAPPSPPAPPTWHLWIYGSVFAICANISSGSRGERKLQPSLPYWGRTSFHADNICWLNSRNFLTAPWSLLFFWLESLHPLHIWSPLGNAFVASFCFMSRSSVISFFKRKFPISSPSAGVLAYHTILNCYSELKFIQRFTGMSQKYCFDT